MALGQGVSSQADFQAAINKLMNQQNNEIFPKPIPPAVPIPAAVGVGAPRAEKKTPSGTGGGIASPLTETSYASRTFWAGSSYTSSDGMLTWEISAVKKTSLTDAANNAVDINWAQPT